MSRQLRELQQRGLKSGINLLAAKSRIDAAKRAAEWVRESGIDNQRIVYLAMSESVESSYN